LIVAMMGCLATAYVAFDVSRWTAPTSVQAAVPGPAQYRTGPIVEEFQRSQGAFRRSLTNTNRREYNRAAAGLFSCV
jgi:hypothetical protein